MTIERIIQELEKRHEEASARLKASLSDENKPFPAFDLGQATAFTFAIEMLKHADM